MSTNNNTNQKTSNNQSSMKAYEQFVRFKEDPTGLVFLKLGNERLEVGKTYTLRQIEDLTRTEITAEGSKLAPVSDDERKAIIGRCGFSTEFNKLMDPRLGFVVGTIATGPAVIMAITKDSFDLAILKTGQRVTVAKLEARLLPGPARERIITANRQKLYSLEDERNAALRQRKQREEDRKAFRALHGGIYNAPYHGQFGSVNETPLGLILVVSVFRGPEGSKDVYATVRRILKTDNGYTLSNESETAAVYSEKDGTVVQCMFPTSREVVEAVANLPETKEVLARQRSGRS